MSIYGWVVALVVLSVSFADGAEAKKNKKRSAGGYVLTVIKSEMRAPLDINTRGDVLIERQLIPQAQAAPLIVSKNGKETAAFQCQGTENDTVGEGMNNGGDIVGHCGHDARAPGLFAFVANPRAGTFKLLAFPGADTTWGYGINDLGQVVGFYENPIQPPFCCFLPPRHLHSFLYDPQTNEYRTIDNPLAEAVGGWTWLYGINNKGQIIGHYNTIRNIPSEEFPFIYDNGVFTPIVIPGAFSVEIVDINNDGAVLGLYSATGCQRCIFLFDDDMYFTITLALPPNEPRPDGLPAGNATLATVGGLNDKGQFVGSYLRTVEWGPNHLGGIGPKTTELVNFIATPGR